ncbi:P-loop containing nucleoside triphosphate hydrolase [Pseudocohnilembus persalinus]|uniref:p-loop containing nucleoside triphosphate hydrolase n=1 Tax=Pseudocohnilembus persalinus TaxID=266149 RepID=A0A0V0Q7L1_PSEPJ|nr:P-loop containing nucleoside triphosphate hydrolase [Pseudocohnilembus persalinus]|eukprot:KRW98217.1 P-loop containing nucleoside triphosphate hydrolase [Pseudocohnilembus persalinus]
MGLSLFKLNFTQHVQKYQLLTTSTPLPQDTYYPVLDMRTKEIHQYSPRLLQYGTELELKKNPDIKQMKNQGKEFIHQGIFRDFLVKQLKDDQEKIYTPKEILLVGRSNVGKSSLINNIFGVKDLSLVSRKTGSTQKLRQYEFKKNQGILIDSPGYGFSQINVQAQRRNQGLLLDYLKISTRCVRVFLLINAEHGIQVSDAAFLYRIKPFKLNVQVVLTKTDKIKENQLQDRMYRNAIEVVQPCSSNNTCNKLQ